MATSSETLALTERGSRVLHTGDSVIRNVSFSIADYLLQPLLTLLTARYYVKMLGTSVFGVWMLVLAIIGSSGSICTGFGDAALKYISTMRGRVDPEGIARVLAASVLLNGTLGLALAISLSALGPWAGKHVFRLSGGLAELFPNALRIGACVLVLRSVSFVFVGTLRAFERYQRATQVTATSRIISALFGLVLVARGFGLSAILTATLFCEMCALAALWRYSVHLCAAGWKLSQIREWRSLTSFGFFNWIQAVSGTLFSQADRLLVAAALGPTSLTYYGVCVQCAQPIHGLMAASNNVLFPHLSTRLEAHGQHYLHRVLSRVFWLNLLCVLSIAVLLVFLSGPILTVWMGGSFSMHAASTLAVVAVSFALIAVSIPGHYALMALGEVRFLTVLNLTACALSLVLAWILLPKLGTVGSALARCAYGPITWLVYVKIQRVSRTRETEQKLGN